MRALPPTNSDEDLRSPGELRSCLQGIDTVSMDSGGSSYDFHRDGLGSIVNLTSAAGATELSYD